MDVGKVRWELVVVDNGSSGRTREVVESFAGRLPVRYEREAAPGKSNALNRVAPELKGCLVCFTDDDILFPPDWLQTVCETAKRRAGYGVMGGRILPLWTRSAKSAHLRHPFAAEAYTVVDFGDRAGEYPAGNWPAGASAVYRRKLLDARPFDPGRGPVGDGRIIGNDTELAQRLAAKGVRFFYEPRMTVRHMIQPGQMLPGFLWRRAWLKGRTLARIGPIEGARRVGGVPTWMFGELGRCVVRTAERWIGLERGPRIDCELQVAERCGWIAGAWGERHQRGGAG